MLSIIIPVYNEELTICDVLDSISKINLIDNQGKEIIIVNDGSTDNTTRKVSSYKKKSHFTSFKYLELPYNQGKGAAIHRGIIEAEGEYLIIQDADLEYSPADYNDLLAPIINGYADVVFGSRFQGSKPHRILFFWHTIGNKMLTLMSNAANNLNLTDMETCYKLFRTNQIQSLNLTEKRFGFEPEVTAKISRIPNIRIYEVGIAYYGRTYAEGKKIGWKDGFRAMYCIIKYGILDKS